MNYQQSSPIPDKLLEPDGSIVARSGTGVAGPSAAGALQYLFTSRF
ncbi:MAG TPA: hypothetical protein VIY29_00630 [Ktedonobacteraceae bacterium]